ncbi:Holliday junction branch migration protein RuvA [Candidatus Wolfebacteria bacterium]|nr:MAG: Holliday junction branch migration protein RuvA [Candidatus Wolfebacteria bacterium]
MIGHLEGKLLHDDTNYIIVSVGGIGYKVFVTMGARDTISGSNSTVSLWTYLVVRETALDLYGFSDRNELGLFEKLLTVSGIGPKSALSILSITSVDTLKQAIISGDTSHLTSISGIGTKAASKIVLELKDKITYDGNSTSKVMKEDLDVLEALKALGYRESEARDALQQIPKEAKGTSARVTEALKSLGSS